MIRIGVLCSCCWSLPRTPSLSSPRPVRSASRRQRLCHRAGLHGAAHAGPVPVSQLTIWGLHGLTALDPDLATELHDGKLRLTVRDHLIADNGHRPPKRHQCLGARPADFAVAAAGASVPVRRAGTQGIVQSFFDELFNHLDPYSRYVRRARPARIATAGSAGRRRAAPCPARTAIVVAEAIADGPGALAGIRPGDTILAVDGQSTRGKDAATVTAWIAGPEADTASRLPGAARNDGTHSAELERAMVPPETVFAQRIGDVAAAPDHRVQPQHRSAPGGGRSGKASPAPHPPEGIILDLRGNRGGLLRQAVERGRHAAARRRRGDDRRARSGRDADLALHHRASWRRTCRWWSLVDGRTASAAEILAAALADRGRAVVVGSSTLGKGLVQTIAPLPDGGELFVTWSRVLAPRGWPIQGLGVLPQVCTSLGQSTAELAARRAGAGPAADGGGAGGPPRGPRTAAAGADPGDPQRLPRRGGARRRLDTARALIHDPAAYAAALLPPLRSPGDGSGKRNRCHAVIDP